MKKKKYFNEFLAKKNRENRLHKDYSLYVNLYK